VSQRPPEVQRELRSRRTRRQASPPPRRPRERRLSGATAATIVGAIALCVLVTWRRDKGEREYYRVSMEACRAQLQERLDRAGFLPPRVYRQPNGWPRSLPQHFIDSAGRLLVDRLPQPVLVAYSQLIRQFLRSHGHYVILLEGKRLTLEWWSGGKVERVWGEQQRLIEELSEQTFSRPPRLP